MGSFSDGSAVLVAFIYSWRFVVAKTIFGRALSPICGRCLNVYAIKVYSKPPLMESYRGATAVRKNIFL